jgi:hypothetical protein
MDSAKELYKVLKQELLPEIFSALEDGVLNNSRICNPKKAKTTSEFSGDLDSYDAFANSQEILDVLSNAD